MSKFCKLPWLAVSIRADGKMQPCCTISDFDNVSDWKQYQQLDQLKKIKQQFLNGNQPTECVNCWRAEDAGVESLRQMHEPIAANFDISDNAHPVYIELAVTQICNLACCICHPNSSSRWIADYNKLAEFNIEIEPYSAKPARHLKNPEYVDWVLTHQTNLQFMQFIGGEPFADQVQEQADLLNKLNNPESILLSYMTNGTFLPPAALTEQWKKFKQVNITASIDGTHEVFEYGRYPAQWEQVQSNLTYWACYAKTAGNILFKVNSTVSSINVHHVPEFDAWVQSQGFDVTYTLLTNPAWYNIKNLNTAVKEHLKQRLYNFPFIIKALTAEAIALSGNSTFDSNISALDRLRNQSFGALYPTEYITLFNLA